MAQEQNEQKHLSATERAEDLLNQVGRRIGYLTVQFGQRAQQTASSMRSSVGHEGQTETVPGEQIERTESAQIQGNGAQVVQKAEGTVDRIGDQASHYATIASSQAQRFIALMREEAEDIWAEAQHLRHHKGPEQ